MRHYKFLAIKSQFWKPKEDYIAKIVTALKDKVQDGDFVVISVRLEQGINEPENNPVAIIRRFLVLRGLICAPTLS